MQQRSDIETCLEVTKATVGENVEILNTGEWQGYACVEVEVGIAHATVRHGQAGKGEREWVRNDDGDGIREVHCNDCESAGLHTSLRIFRGVHKKYLANYVATNEAMTQAKRINASVVQRMCFVEALSQSKET